MGIQAEDDSAERLRIGAAVHAARREKKLSIKQLSSESSLSTGMISQIERGISLPSLKSLMMLATALGVPIGRFFNAPETPPATGSSIYVVHKNERPQLKLTPLGVTKQNLVPDLPGALDLFEVKLAPGGSSGPEFYSHPGEKAGVVLGGRLRLWISELPTILEAGDSFRFPSHLPHRFDNPGEAETHLIWIALNAEKSRALLTEATTQG